MLENKRTWRLNSRWWSPLKNEYPNGWKSIERHRGNNELGVVNRLFLR